MSRDLAPVPPPPSICTITREQASALHARVRRDLTYYWRLRGRLQSFGYSRDDHTRKVEHYANLVWYALHAFQGVALVAGRVDLHERYVTPEDDTAWCGEGI